MDFSPPPARPLLQAEPASALPPLIPPRSCWATEAPWSWTTARPDPRVKPSSTANSLPPARSASVSSAAPTLQPRVGAQKPGLWACKYEAGAVVLAIVAARSAGVLKQPGRSLSAAHAHGHNAIAMLAPLHLIGH